ncbi:hypothetical protein E8F20_05895 [Pseudomonas sp. BN415]|uniref:hypothetical protein n=1 Tax=Pseudomonas sp. BN415 TaxID=2567889 RepID=UPI0024570BF0|nr:hypothetical protein [Pseudomonas sp. BN415]MDH4581407.1 hypothetical protein [Pseudomonas sp. BN415]
MRFALALLVALAVTGCASKSTQPIERTSYQLGQEQVAVLGVPFLSEERGSVEHSKQWQGVLFGGMHHSYTKSPDYRLTELYYGGLEGGAALVILQEMAGNATSPSRQSYSLDLNQNDTFQIGRYRLQVLSASQANMRFKVVSN